MAPNEQESVADQAVQEEKKLGSLTMVEQVVNEYAKKYASRYRVDENSYNVVLVTKFKGIMGLKRGPVVQIVLLWPDAQPNINTLLDSAFRTISRNRLVDNFAVESVIHIKRNSEDRKRLIREKIGNDESDIILDLIPKHRIFTTVTTTVEYEDVLTGEKISVTHKARKEQFRGQDIGNWIKLSRIVRDNHAEEATRYADVEQGTVSNNQDDCSTDERPDRGDGESSEGDGRQGYAEVAGGDAGEVVDVDCSHQIAG